MSLEALINELKENPKLKASSETLTRFVDSPEFFEEFIKTKKINKLKNKLYTLEGGLLRLIEIHKEKFKEFIHSKYKTLDDVSRNKPLGSILGLKNKDGKNIAKALVDLKLMNAEIFEGCFLNKRGRRTTFYFNPEVVGEEQARKNLIKWIQDRYQTLDCIRQSTILAHALKLPNANTSTIVKEIVNQKIMGPIMPDNHPINKKNRTSCYVLPKIVGEEQARENLKTWVRGNYKTLDDIRQNISLVLTSALGAPNNNLTNVIKEIVNQKIMSPIMPDNHPIGKKRKTSWYVHPEIVGKKQARANIKRYVQDRYKNINDIKDNRALISVLGIPDRKITTLRAKIAELGWLNDDFRSYAESSLPESFTKQKSRSKKTKAANNKQISKKLEHKNSGTTTFVKGEAFEQLFGLFLSYTNPNKLIVPQYCLDVGKDYFRTRADFKIGNNIYELKWGHATENIEATYHKHHRLLKNRDLSYHLIRLTKDEGEEVKVPCEIFDSILERNVNDENIKSKFRAIVSILQESSEKYLDVNEVDFIRQLRDFLYDKIEKANKKKGKERQGYIEDRIRSVQFLGAENKYKLYDFLIKQTDRHFSKLEAFFEYPDKKTGKSKLYRGFIDVRELQKEQVERYETFYYFGKTKFNKELDRNLAVLIECSPYCKRIEDVLEQHNEKVIFNIQKLNKKLSISTTKYPNYSQVKSLKEAKELLEVSNEMYKFALDYIKENQDEC